MKNNEKNSLIGKCTECSNFIETDCLKNRLPKIGTIEIISATTNKKQDKTITVTQNMFIKIVDTKRFCLDYNK